MSHHQKFLGGLFLGAAAGATFAIFFSSDKGKALLASITTKLQDLRGEINEVIAKSNVIVDEMEAKISGI